MKSFSTGRCFENWPWSFLWQKPCPVSVLRAGFTFHSPGVSFKIPHLFGRVVGLVAVGAEKKWHGVDPVDLPVACPMDLKDLWQQHPRVFLQFNEEGRAVCPYCGDRYQLNQSVLSA